MLKALYIKHKEIILYAFFGGLTTLVNIFTYIISTRIFFINSSNSTIIAWCIAVIFAYFTNRVFVFQSQNTKLHSFFLEFVSFVSCRVLSGLIDYGIMIIFVEHIGLNDVLIKSLSNIIVILFNYKASRLFIFKSKKQSKKK